MTGLSDYSWVRLRTCDERLQNIIEEVSEVLNIRVLSGARSQREQDQLYSEGRTKLKFPKSKHNIGPDIRPLSHAVDVVPYPIDWSDRKRFVYMAGHIMMCARSQGVKIRWGGNWDMDEIIIDDQSFDDLPHFEIVDEGPQE